MMPIQAPPPEARLPSEPPVGACLAIVAGVLMAVGVFLPWISLTVLGRSGPSRNAFQLGAINVSFSIDGVIALALGVVAVVIGITGLTNRALTRLIQRSPMIVGIGAGVLAATRLSELNTLVNNANPALKGLGNASIGLGFYMFAVGAGLAVYRRTHPQKPFAPTARRYWRPIGRGSRTRQRDERAFGRGAEPRSATSCPGTGFVAVDDHR